MYFLGLQNVSSELPWYHVLRDILVEKLFEQNLGRDFFWDIFRRGSSSDYVCDMFPQIFFGRGFFWNCLEETFMQSLFG